MLRREEENKNSREILEGEECKTNNWSSGWLMLGKQPRQQDGVGKSGVEIGSLGPLQLQENMQEDHGEINHQETIC